jgi:hypothetical protein
VKIDTVDHFQGDENDIILLSLVRANQDDQSNRICVAMSRAKIGLYIFGNLSKKTTKKTKGWPSIKELLENNGQAGTSLGLQCSYHPDSKTNISSPEEFAELFLCNSQCGETLSCGHICDDTCHERDRYVAICSKRSRNNSFCAHATSQDAAL